MRSCGQVDWWRVEPVKFSEFFRELVQLRYAPRIISPQVADRREGKSEAREVARTLVIICSIFSFRPSNLRSDRSNSRSRRISASEPPLPSASSSSSRRSPSARGAVLRKRGIADSPSPMPSIVTCIVATSACSVRMRPRRAQRFSLPWPEEDAEEKTPIAAPVKGS